VNQTFYTFCNFNKNTIILDRFHFAAFQNCALFQITRNFRLFLLLQLERLSRLKLRLLVRSLLRNFLFRRRRLHRQRYASLFHGFNPNLHLLVDGNDIANVLDKASLQLRNVYQTVVLGTKVHERSICRRRFNFADKFLTDFDV